MWSHWLKANPGWESTVQKTKSIFHFFLGACSSPDTCSSSENYYTVLLHKDPALCILISWNECHYLTMSRTLDLCSSHSLPWRVQSDPFENTCVSVWTKSEVWQPHGAHIPWDTACLSWNINHNTLFDLCGTGGRKSRLMFITEAELSPVGFLENIRLLPAAVESPTGIRGVNLIDL